MIDDAEAKHGGVAEPEGEAGDETDLRHFDRVEPVRRIDAVANGATGKNRCADVVADRIAGEAGERSNAIGNFGAANGTQGEPVIEGEREIAASHKKCRGCDIFYLGCL